MLMRMKTASILEADDIKHSKMKDRGNCACGPTYVQVCTQMRKLRFLRKIAKIVNGAKKKTNPQLGLAIFAKIAIFAIFCKNR